MAGKSFLYIAVHVRKYNLHNNDPFRKPCFSGEFEHALFGSSRSHNTPVSLSVFPSPPLKESKTRLGSVMDDETRFALGLAAQPAVQQRPIQKSGE
jgi:hypothetical protein